MNPFLTANLRADRELRASIHHQELKSIQGQLESALPLLKSAYDKGEKAGLKQSNYELLQALGDALTACTDALERIDDAPDEQCPECDGEGEVPSMYGGTLYSAGYSDHGHTSWGICPLCDGSKHCTSQQVADWLGIAVPANPLHEVEQTQKRQESSIAINYRSKK